MIVRDAQNVVAKLAVQNQQDSLWMINMENTVERRSEKQCLNCLKKMRTVTDRSQSPYFIQCNSTGIQMVDQSEANVGSPD